MHHINRFGGYALHPGSFLLFLFPNSVDGLAVRAYNGNLVITWGSGLSFTDRVRYCNLFNIILGGAGRFTATTIGRPFTANYTPRALGIAGAGVPLSARGVNPSLAVQAMRVLGASEFEFSCTADAMRRMSRQAVTLALNGNGHGLAVTISNLSLKAAESEVVLYKTPKATSLSLNNWAVGTKAGVIESNGEKGDRPKEGKGGKKKVDLSGPVQAVVIAAKPTGPPKTDAETLNMESHETK